MDNGYVDSSSLTPALSERCPLLLAGGPIQNCPSSSEIPTFSNKEQPNITMITAPEAFAAVAIVANTRNTSLPGTLGLGSGSNKRAPHGGMSPLPTQPICVCSGTGETEKNNGAKTGLGTAEERILSRASRRGTNTSAKDFVTSKKDTSMDLYVLGGYNGSTFDMDECRHMFRYDSYHQRWDSLGEMPVPRFHHTAVVYRDYIYMIGGASVSCANPARALEEAGQVLLPTVTNYQYHPATGMWTELPPMKTRRVYHAAAAAFGNIYVFGGQNEEQTILDTVEIFDIESNTWKVGPSLRHPVMGASATVSGGHIFIVGGITSPMVTKGPQYDRFNVITRAHYLDVYSGQWSSLSSLPIPLVHHAGVCLHGEMFIIGGSTCGRPSKRNVSQAPHLISRKDIFAYNEEDKKWELVGRLSEPRSGCGAAVIGLDICVVGGHGLVKGQVLNTMDQFNLYAKKLAAGPSLPMKKTALQLVAFPSFANSQYRKSHEHIRV